jgi:integrase
MSMLRAYTIRRTDAGTFSVRFSGPDTGPIKFAAGNAPEAEKVRRHIAALQEHRITGAPCGEATQAWLDGISAKWLQRLSEAGLLPTPEDDPSGATIEADAIQWLASPSLTRTRAQEIEPCLRGWIERCKWARVEEITLGRVEEELRSLLTGDPATARKRLKPNTVKKHGQILRQFCAWCVRVGKLRVNPLAELAHVTGGTDRERRALELEEQHWLIETTATSQGAAAPEQLVTPPPPVESVRVPTPAEVQLWPGARRSWSNIRTAIAAEVYRNAQGHLRTTVAAIQRANGTAWYSSEEAIRRRLKRMDGIRPGWRADQPRRPGGQVQKPLGPAGAERALLYRLAIDTGLRAGELRTLTRTSFVLDSRTPAVVLPGKFTKNRRAAVQPISPITAELLRKHIASLPPGVPAFSLPRTDKMAAMIRRDLAKARAAWINAAENLEERASREESRFLCDVDDTGAVFDFHALRTTFITNMARAHVPLQHAVRLARHSDPKLTLGVYTKLGVTDLSDAAAMAHQLTQAAPTPAPSPTPTRTNPLLAALVEGLLAAETGQAPAATGAGAIDTNKLAALLQLIAR